MQCPKFRLVENLVENSTNFCNSTDFGPKLNLLKGDSGSGPIRVVITEQGRRSKG